MQLGLFPKLDTAKLKEGKDNCPCCGRLMRAYCKTLDARLVELLHEIYQYCREKNNPVFQPRIIWGDNHHKINDFQKLHYWGFISRYEDKTASWKLRQLGVDFLKGTVQAPVRLWVFKNEVIEQEAPNTISMISPRWQIQRSDYAMDYIQRPIIQN